MPNMLDYERLIRENADLRVELAKYTKNSGWNSSMQRLNVAHEHRWREIEFAKVSPTEAEVRRLQTVIKGWEERYDILCQLYMSNHHMKVGSGRSFLKGWTESSVALYYMARDFAAKLWDKK